MSNIFESLTELYDKARKEQLWFYSPFANIWFTPDELLKAQQNGEYLWGPSNWQLRNPNERIAEIQKAINAKLDEITLITNKLKAVEPTPQVPELVPAVQPPSTVATEPPFNPVFDTYAKRSGAVIMTEAASEHVDENLQKHSRPKPREDCVQKVRKS